MFTKPALPALLSIAAVVLAACKTAMPPMAPLNLAEAGWKVRQGQAVWRPDNRAEEIAGELLVATHPDGRSLVQFTKTPIQMVLAQRWPMRWEVHFPPNNVLDGYGSPPSRMIWLHLAKFLDGEEPPSRWKAERKQQSWKLENPGTGEKLEGYVTP